MSRLPRLKSRELIRALERMGFFIDHQTGSHVILYRDDHSHPVSVPYHNRDLKLGTLKNILRQANIDADELMKHL